MISNESLLHVIFMTVYNDSNDFLTTIQHNFVLAKTRTRPESVALALESSFYNGFQYLD